MDLRKQKKSANVEQSIRGNPVGKGSHLLYKEKIVQDALKGASQAFQDRIRGKTDRENKFGVSAETMDYLKQIIRKKK